MTKVITLSFFMLYAAFSFGCSCMDTPTIESSFKISQEVFTGKFLDKRSILSEDGRVTHFVCTFQIEKSWKGQTEGLIEVSTAISSAACGYSFTPEEDYLVYASRFNIHSPLRTDMCTRTNGLRNVGKELETLNNRNIEWKMEEIVEEEEEVEESTFTQKPSPSGYTMKGKTKKAKPAINYFIKLVSYLATSITHLLF